MKRSEIEKAAAYIVGKTMHIYATHEQYDEAIAKAAIEWALNEIPRDFSKLPLRPHSSPMSDVELVCTIEEE